MLKIHPTHPDSLAQKQASVPYSARHSHHQLTDVIRDVHDVNYTPTKCIDYFFHVPRHRDKEISTENLHGKISELRLTKVDWTTWMDPTDLAFDLSLLS
mmetsp:Transcript_1654/g.3188  ORF Transcript_1654/g.3188 Transcript_1654/m.3188 type:complete len:99 (-) Transcript_1654:2358-2654(-)